MSPSEVVEFYRAIFPLSRITSPFRYVRNGSGVKQRGCALCGAEGPTWSAKYRQTVKASRWEADHACWELNDAPDGEPLWSWLWTRIDCRAHEDCKKDLSLSLGCALDTRQHFAMPTASVEG
jgi:hypothetical protein